MLSLIVLYNLNYILSLLIRRQQCTHFEHLMVYHVVRGISKNASGLNFELLLPGISLSEDVEYF